MKDSGEVTVSVTLHISVVMGKIDTSLISGPFRSFMSKIKNFYTFR